MRRYRKRNAGYRRRRNTRKRYNRSSRRGAARSLAKWHPFGKSKAAVLTYHQIISIDPVDDTIDDHVFHANSLWDPDTTGTGHQPYGFDQIMAAFNHFTVLGSRITVTLVNPYSSAHQFFIQLRDDYTNQGSTDDGVRYWEQPGTKAIILPPGDKGSVIRTFSNSFSAKKFFSKPTKTMLGNTPYSGTASSNPTEGAFFHVMTCHYDGAVDPGPLSMHVHITYYAVFTEPNTLLQS